MSDEEARLNLLVETIASTSAQLAARITLAMAKGGIGPNRVVAWMEKFHPPPVMATMTARVNALILDACLKEITLFDTLQDLYEKE
jgi:hypothetical protein